MKNMFIVIRTLFLPMTFIIILLSLIVSFIESELNINVNDKQIIADHTVVNQYNDIPQHYIEEVKKMWVAVLGESHSVAYKTGLTLLETLDPTYEVNVTSSGLPEGPTSDYLRSCNASWGDLNNATGWLYWLPNNGYGEEDWYTSEAAITQTKAGITYSNTTGPVYSALGFGWCYDGLMMGSHVDTYIAATQEYIDHCTANGYPTKVFFTTGPVDGYIATGSVGYNNYLRWERIRDSVANNSTRILFDYADILCYDDDGTSATEVYDGNTFYKGTVANTGVDETGHITDVGALRLAKAMWWMLARIAGWDGETTSISGEMDTESDLFKYVIHPGELHIQFLNPELFGTVSLYSINGALLYSKHQQQDLCVLNTCTLDQGIYILTVHTDKSSQSKKIALL